MRLTKWVVLSVADADLPHLVPGPGPPSNVEGLCTIVLWGQPSQPNGEVTGFNVQFYVPDVWYGTLFRKEMNDIYHTVQDSDNPSDYSVSQIFVGVSELHIINYSHVDAYTSGVAINSKM